MTRNKSHSGVQRDAETLAIKELGSRLKICLQPKELRMGKSAKVQLDGYCQYCQDGKKKFVLVESYAHIGKVKPAQEKKVLTDVLKLALVMSYLKKKYPNSEVDAYIVFVDQEAKKVLSNAKWGGLAAKEFKIKAEQVKLPEKMIREIRTAQRDQNLQND